MIKPGNSTADISNHRRQNRLTEPGVIIFAEIAFATLLLYLANQPLNIDDLKTPEEMASATTVPANLPANLTESLTDTRANNLTTGVTVIPGSLPSDFTDAAGVAVAASELNTTDALVRN